jgi:hypothetical protein
MTKATITQSRGAEARSGTPTDHPASPPRAIPFTDAEIDGFHADDRHMAMAVVGIMSTIFIVAVLLYTVIASLASGGPS